MSDNEPQGGYVTTPGALIECPNCKKESVRKALPSEVSTLLDSAFREHVLIEDGADESDLYLLLCFECGWFASLHSFLDWRKWYAKTLKKTSRKKKGNLK